MTREQLFFDVRRRLETAGISMPELEARELTACALGVDRQRLLMQRTSPVSDAERERLEQLIRSVKDTIGAEERNEIMSDEQKFEAFKRRTVAHNEEAYGTEIRAKYGDQEMDEANAAVMGLTQAQYQEWTDLGREIQERLEAAVQAGLSLEDQEGKEITALHRRWLTIAGSAYDPAKHRGIAELYAADERFTAYYDKTVSGCARFLRDAICRWAE